MISSILQYSTLDIKFLDSNLRELTKISEEIIITICDHFFTGVPEDKSLINSSLEIINKYPKACAYMFEWDGVKENTAYYHNLSRYLGSEKSRNQVLLLVDGDEIVDGDRFKQWLEIRYDNKCTYWMTSYWYFREPIYRSTKTESAGLLIPKVHCNWDLELREERQQLFNKVPCFVNGDSNLILSLDNVPMVHHFSWVRSKNEMIKKVENWGHKNDKRWVDLVNEEFSRSFNGTDFVHGYEYELVQNVFNI